MKTAPHPVAVGYQAAYFNTTGTQNDSNGTVVSLSQAGYNGSYNVCTGLNALYANTTGPNNSAFGYTAGTAVTTGIGNTLLGNGAGNNITTGSYNVMVGFTAKPSSATVSSEIVVGSGTAQVGKGANTGFISPNSGAVYQGNNASTWSTTSDRRLKKNIVDSTIGLAELKQLQTEYRTVDLNIRTADEHY